MNEGLQKKIDRAIRLLKSIENATDKNGKMQPIEIAYSGGKDSDVILQLAKESGINFKAIYKCTTIDPPGTIKHVLDRGGGRNTETARRNYILQTDTTKRTSEQMVSFLLCKTQGIQDSRQVCHGRA